MIDIWLGEEVERRIFSLKDANKGFPGGSVVRTPPANAGDTGLIPDPARSPHAAEQQSHAPQLLSLCPRATEACVSESSCSTREAAAMRSPSTVLDSSTCLPQLEETPEQQQRPSTAKRNKYIVSLRMQRGRMK